MGLSWPNFLDWFAGKWRPGDHFSISALTGAGKTTFQAGVLPRCRRYVLALDVKGGDEILGSLGWPRLERWPGLREMARMVARNNKDNKPSRYVVGPMVNRIADRPRLKQVLTEAVEGAFDMGGWTVYIDELQIATDRRMMDLDNLVAFLLVSARQPKKLTVVSSFQAPSWVSTEAIRQPVWFGVSQTRDEQVVQRLAEAMGKDWHEVMGLMRGLPEHGFGIVDRNPYSPIVCTVPRRIG